MMPIKVHAAIFLSLVLNSNIENMLTNFFQKRSDRGLTFEQKTLKNSKKLPEFASGI
jgi:hypothetical protein